MIAVKHIRKLLLCLVPATVLAAAPALAQDGIRSMLDEPVSGQKNDIERFCSNIADAARERRYALQKAELEELSGQIQKKIKVLEEKRAELEKWVEQRENFSEAANAGLVEVYGKMRPDAAAQRMEKLPSELSAALLTKLSPRNAGEILNEMSAERAAMVTVIMAAAGKREMTN